MFVSSSQNRTTKIKVHSRNWTGWMLRNKYSYGKCAYTSHRAITEFQESIADAILDETFYKVENSKILYPHV